MSFGGKIKNIRIRQHGTGSNYRLITIVTGQDRGDVNDIRIQFNAPFPGPPPLVNLVTGAAKHPHPNGLKTRFLFDNVFDDPGVDDLDYSVTVEALDASGAVLTTETKTVTVESPDDEGL